MDFTVFQNQVFFCTMRIVVPMPERLPAGTCSVGTGFLVEAPVTENEKVLLLVSNKHVFVSRNQATNATGGRRS